MIIVIGSGKHSAVVEESLIKRKLPFKNISKAYNSSDESFIEKKISKNKNSFFLHIAIGDNDIRKKIYFFFKKKKYKFQSIIDPSAIISKKTIIKEGTFVGPGVIINAYANISSNCIINTGSIVEHDVKIYEHTHIAPGSKILGSSIIGKKCLIGAGSIVNNNIRVKDDCIIASGSVIIKNILSKGLYAGVPAKKKK